MRVGKSPKLGITSPGDGAGHGGAAATVRWACPGDHRSRCQMLEPAAPSSRPAYMDKRALVALVALLASGVVACGNVASPGTAPGSGGSASPGHTSGGSRPGRPQGGTPSQPAGGSTSLTTADNGATVRLTTGQSITATLVPAPPFSWHLPAAAGSIVHRTGTSGGYPERKPARATFQAVRPGRAVLSAIDDTQCLHAPQPCMLPQRSWQVVIIVTQP